MVFLLFLIYMIPVLIVFSFVLNLAIWLATKLFQVAIWLVKQAFSQLWKLLVFIVMLAVARMRSSQPPKY